MKRLELVKHILSHGCLILREGGNHTELFNPANSGKPYWVGTAKLTT